MSRLSVRARALLSAVCALAPAALAHAEEATALPPVTITSAADPIDAPLGATILSNGDLTAARLTTSDTASLFTNAPGVSAASAGGVSSLPAIHGLGADRVNLIVNGMQMGVACANEMNTPLSYLDPSAVGRAMVMAGITPVSMGGDSIAGTIAVDSPAPQFSTTGEIETHGQARVFYRSNQKSLGGSLTASVAGEDFALSYTGSKVAADNYTGGGNDGVVRSTEYESANQALTLAYRSGTNLFVFEAGQQYIPRQGFPNQYMDMLMNRAAHVNARYEGMFAWGTLEARAYWQTVRHYMNFLIDKGGSAGGGMPMDTRSQTFGYSLKATFDLTDRDTLRLGSEFVHLTLDDWWPPVAGSMMMGPQTYVNIADGVRNRLGTYGELQRKWTGEWSTLLGVRSDVVWSDAGKVQPYSWTSMMSMDDRMAAMAFNAAPHAKTDVDVDITALVRYAPSAHATYEFGYARKSRAPTLYERYSWGRGSMSSRMIGWFGDGNGYVGNLDLKPEVANTISATGAFNGGAAMPWSVRLTPYYTRIENYVGVDKLKNLTNSMNTPTGFVQLQFANHEAELYGADLAASLGLWSSVEAGKADLRLAAGWVQGRDLTLGGDLYHLMPVHARLTFEHTMGAWSSAAELELVGKKSRVDDVRHEPMTPAYALLNLRGSYTWRNFRVDAGIENVFDTAYDLPLGGLSLGDYKATGNLRPLPGMGRSLNIALTASL